MLRGFAYCLCVSMGCVLWGQQGLGYSLSLRDLYCFQLGPETGSLEKGLTASRSEVLAPRQASPENVPCQCCLWVIFFLGRVSTGVILGLLDSEHQPALGRREGSGSPGLWRLGGCNPQETSAPCHHLVMGTKGMRNVIAVVSLWEVAGML